MSAGFKEFQKLHQATEPLLLGNVWNVQSAQVFEKLKFKAIATSSAAVAETLGYKDGENMPFDEYLFIIKRIKESVSIPFSVDLEGGYGRTPEDIVSNIRRLHDLGVAGINLEDSVINNAIREIVDMNEFAGKLTKVIALLKEEGRELFINVRSDVFLLNLPGARAEALQRIAGYGKTGVHGIFFPCITDIDDISAVVSATSLPVNVMCMPGLPDFGTLQKLGVKRISIGNFLNKATYQNLENQASVILNEGSFDSLFSKK